MIEPRSAIFRQFAEILREDGIKLSISRNVFEQIAELAMEYKAGARSLRGIFEEMMTSVLYAIPDTPGLSEVRITSLFEEAQLISQPSPAT